MAEHEKVGLSILRTKDRIDPATVTKPVQLLAAWLAALIALEGTLLAGATFVSKVVWLQATLGLAAVGIIALFIGLVFLLQTKFRTEILEDTFYAEYQKRIDDTASRGVVVARMTDQHISAEELIMSVKGGVSDLERKLASLDKSKPNLLTLRLGEGYVAGALQQYLSAGLPSTILKAQEGSYSLFNPTTLTRTITIAQPEPLPSVLISAAFIPWTAN